MCGIAGMFNVQPGKPVDVNLLKRMADTIRHRGPDAEGLYTDRLVGLAHRRLSIIDLEGGNQPMTNEDQTVWVVFNGEIYNFEELRESLLKKGHIFKTRSDTEVIVHLYEERGEQCFRELRGMFAIALWDKREQKLLLARDRVGKKPLFYLYDGKRAIFASELKAILEVPRVPQDLDLQALSDYFSLLYVPAPKSIFKAIRKVRPGHYMSITSQGVKEVEYWDINFLNPLEISEAEWCERILEAYRESVRLRLLSDVPLGAFLSGGVDSSSVLAMMSGLMGQRVVTASIGFKEKEFDELHYASQVSAQFNSIHKEQVVWPDAVAVTQKLIWHYDEPFADSSAIPTYYVSKLAREHVTVALSGDGGDELFAGYRRYFLDSRENKLRVILPESIRRPAFNALASIYPKADWAPQFLRGKTTFESLACSHIEGYFRSMSAFRPDLKNRILHPDVKHKLSGYETVDLFKYYYDRAPTSDPLTKIQYVDMKTYLPDDILVKVDRASMANSLEVRAPILDHQFMELIAAMPSNLKLRHGVGKYLFKKSLTGILPDEVLTRKKMGFGVPVGQWLKKDLKEMAYSLLFNGSEDGLLDKKLIERVWKEHQRGLRSRTTELWALVTFRMWQRAMEARGTQIS